MSMMRKIAAIALVAVLSVSLAGCVIFEVVRSLLPGGTIQPTTPVATTEPESVGPMVPETTGGHPDEESGDPFTPSVTQKGAPELVGIGTGTTVALIHDEHGQELGTVQRAEMDVIALFERDDRRVTPEQKAELEAAVESLTDAPSLDMIAPGLIAALAEGTLSPEDLVVRDLFHVVAPAAARKQLASLKNSTITVVFDLGELQSTDNVVFMQYLGDLEMWYVVEPGDVEFLGDGHVQVRFQRDIGTLAIVVEKK